MTLVLILFNACGSRDRDIKADIASKAKEDVNFAGVHFTVENRRVTLWGKCPTEKSRARLMQKLETINVIEGIEDKVVIAPVCLDSNFDIKQQVDSVLASYPGVSAEISGGAVHLLGSVKSAELQKMLQSVGKVSTNTINVAKLSMDIN